MQLRPLSFGEIFDRAITLYVRNFVPFFGIALVLLVPLAVLQYFYDSSQSTQSTQFSELLRILTDPRAKPAPAVLIPSGQLPLLVSILVSDFFLWPFAANAVAAGVARLYTGRPIAFRTCYAVVLRRWSSILGVLMLEGLVLFAWCVALFIIVVIMAMLAAALILAIMPLGVVAGIGAVIGFIVALFTIAPIAIALNFATYAVVLEEQNPIAAMGLSFRRVFTRSEFGRAMLFALAATVISLGVSSVSATVTFLALSFHLVAVDVVLNALLQAVFAPFSAVLIAVYYYDVRIRREGFDLEVELERLANDSLVA